MKKVSIPIEAPLTGHKGPVREVIVREPTFEEYLRLGDPLIWVPLPEGGMFPTENTAVITEYVKLLVVEPDYLICIQGGFDLARKIKDTVLGFFLPAADPAAGSKT
jgi:hypothetical protein